MQSNSNYEIISENFTKAQEFLRSNFNTEASLKFICYKDISTIGDITTKIFDELAYRVLFSGKPICVFNELISDLTQKIDKVEDSYDYKLIQCEDFYFILCLYGENMYASKATEICSAFISQAVLAIKQAQFSTIKQNSDRANSFITGCAELSHEFKNPLNVILTSLQLLRLKLKQKASQDYDKEYVQLLNFTEDNAMKISRLSSNFLDGAKLQVGAVQLSLRLENLCEKIYHSVQQMSVICMKYGIKLIFKDLTAGSKMCFFDDIKIDKIILNLLSNAIYSICETKKQNGKITVEVTNDNNYFYVNVQDNGKGISNKYIANIFDAFFSKRNLQVVEGTGLGLAICKDLVLLHKGQISAKSLKIGACFTFSIYRGLTSMCDEEEILRSNETTYNVDYIKIIFSQELAQLEYKINKLHQ